MRRSTVLNLRSFRLLEILKNNKILVLLCVCFSVGVIIGTVTVSSDIVSSFTTHRFERFINARYNESFGSIIISSSTIYLLFLIVLFISGTSMLGIVLVPLTVLFRGFFDGSLSAFLYSEYQLKGIALNAVLVIPPLIIFLIGFIYSASESINFSWNVARLTLPRSSPAVLFPYFKNYCTRYSLILLIVLFSSLIDAIVSSFFLPFFQI